MARTARTSLSDRVVVLERYFWPQGQLNFWTLIILATGSTILGVFAEFMVIQNQMKLNVPWLFPFGVTVGALTITFVIIELIMISQKRLLPGMMMLGAFILLALYLTGLIETAILLFGSPTNVSGNCQRWVNNNQSHGATIETLAWLQQNNICSCWYAAFSFWLVGIIFFIWMLFMASQVSQGAFK